MYFPPLQDGQYAVVKTTLARGSFIDGLAGAEDPASGLWRVFDSLAAARNYANAAVATRPWVECGIYGAGRQLVRKVRVYLIFLAPGPPHTGL